MTLITAKKTLEGIQIITAKKLREITGLTASQVSGYVRNGLLTRYGHQPYKYDLEEVRYLRRYHLDRKGDEKIAASIRDYMRIGYTMVQIADEFCVSKGTLNKWMKRMNIKRRSRKEAAKLNRHKHSLAASYSGPRGHAHIRKTMNRHWHEVLVWVDKLETLPTIEECKEQVEERSVSLRELIMMIETRERRGKRSFHHQGSLVDMRKLYGYRGDLVEEKVTR